MRTQYAVTNAGSPSQKRFVTLTHEPSSRWSESSFSTNSFRHSTVRPAELVIYDVLGNLRHSQRVDGTGTLRLGLGCGTPTLELGTGIYFYGLVADETCRVMKKLVIR